MAPNKSDHVKVPIINNIESAKKVFPKDWFIIGKWVNFQSLMEEGSIVNSIFDHANQTPFLVKFSSWHYGPCAIF